jgi:hypothetical protein
MSTPEIGTRVAALTDTEGEQRVLIEVTAIDMETESGWYVYGYRLVRRARPRQTMYPRRYFVQRSA